MKLKIQRSIYDDYKNELLGKWKPFPFLTSDQGLMIVKSKSTKKVLQLQGFGDELELSVSGRFILLPNINVRYIKNPFEPGNDIPYYLMSLLNIKAWYQHIRPAIDKGNKSTYKVGRTYIKYNQIL